MKPVTRTLKHAVKKPRLETPANFMEALECKPKNEVVDPTDHPVEWTEDQSMEESADSEEKLTDQELVYEAACEMVEKALASDDGRQLLRAAVLEFLSDNKTIQNLIKAEVHDLVAKQMRASALPGISKPPLRTTKK